MNFTAEELHKLLQILDIATKAGGLAVANEALPLAFKIQKMAEEPQVVDDSNGKE